MTDTHTHTHRQTDSNSTYRLGPSGRMGRVKNISQPSKNSQAWNPIIPTIFENTSMRFKCLPQSLPVGCSTQQCTRKFLVGTLNWCTRMLLVGTLNWCTRMFLVGTSIESAPPSDQSYQYKAPWVHRRYLNGKLKWNDMLLFLHRWSFLDVYYIIQLMVFILKNLTRGARVGASIAVVLLVIGAIATRTNTTFEKH